MTEMALPSPAAGRGDRARWSDRAMRPAMKLADLPAVRQRRRFVRLRDAFYDRLWRDAAASVGAVARPVPGGLTEIRRGATITYLRRAEVMLDTAITVRVLADKALSYRLMAEAGAPVPDHAEFCLSDMAPALALLVRHPGGIAIKPATGTGGGRGVTTGVISPADAERAARHATGFNTRLLAEPMLAGRAFRLLYLDGELIDAVRRDPPQLAGNGRDSIRRLIAAENARRRAAPPFVALSPLVADADCRNHLRAQGLTLASRPAAGTAVEVKAVCNENAAAQNHNVRAGLHPDVVAAGADLVRAMGVRFAGLDVMAADLSVPLSASGAVFGEVNANPGLHHHYLISDPAAGVPVAARLLEFMFNRRQGVICT